MDYMYEEELLVGILSGLFTAVPSVLLGIAAYVLSALGIYTISKRRGLHHPWLAWIPVVNCWLLGSLSDQYHYIVKGENKSKRKMLLVLNILMFVLTIAFGVFAVVLIVNVMDGLIYGASAAGAAATAVGPALSVLGLLLPLAGVAIAYAIIRYMALYDVYKSLDPANCVLFLVLSVVFSVTEPFFLFFNRNKDQGMPPRRQETVYAQQESWENGDKDYL